MTQQGNGHSSPVITDRNECYAALKIFSCAAEEAAQIPEEFYEYFGEEDIYIYNELVGMIGKREKNCLPYVNMCLQTWTNRLEINTDLSADLNLLTFDKWVFEKLSGPVSTECGAKTSYQLIIAVLGEKQGKDTIQTSKRVHATTTQAPSINIPSPYKLCSTTSSGVVRMRKLARIGEVIRKRLITSHSLRGNFHSSIILGAPQRTKRHWQGAGSRWAREGFDTTTKNVGL